MHHFQWLSVQNFNLTWSTTFLWFLHETLSGLVKAGRLSSQLRIDSINHDDLTYAIKVQVLGVVDIWSQNEMNDVDLTKQVSHDLTLILQCRPDLVREPVGDSGLYRLHQQAGQTTAPDKGQIITLHLEGGSHP